MPRSSFDYTQTCIGDCGHVCAAWPVSGKYENGRRSDWVFCDTCTRERYGIVDVEGVLVVYTRVVEKKGRGEVERELLGPAPKKKAAPRKKAAPKPVVKRVNPWEQLVTTRDISDVSGDT